MRLRVDRSGYPQDVAPTAAFIVTAPAFARQPQRRNELLKAPLARTGLIQIGTETAPEVQMGDVVLDASSRLASRTYSGCRRFAICDVVIAQRPLNRFGYEGDLT